MACSFVRVPLIAIVLVRASAVHDEIKLELHMDAEEVQPLEKWWEGLMKYGGPESADSQLKKLMTKIPCTCDACSRRSEKNMHPGKCDIHDNRSYLGLNGSWFRTLVTEDHQVDGSIYGTSSEPLEFVECAEFMVKLCAPLQVISLYNSRQVQFPRGNVHQEGNAWADEWVLVDPRRGNWVGHKPYIGLNKKRELEKPRSEQPQAVISLYLYMRVQFPPGSTAQGLNTDYLLVNLKTGQWRVADRMADAPQFTGKQWRN